MKLDQRAATAVVNLKKDPNFVVFLNALGDYSEVLMKNLVFSNPETLSTSQGKAQCMAEISKAIDNASRTADAYKAQGNDTQI